MAAVKDLRIETMVENGIRKFKKSYPLMLSSDVKSFLITQGVKNEESLREKLYYNEISETDIEDQIFIVLKTSSDLIPHATRKIITIDLLKKAMEKECKIFPWC